jgi:hypothetical protein
MLGVAPLFQKAIFNCSEEISKAPLCQVLGAGFMHPNQWEYSA